jgi:hypothetical protein
LFRYEVARQGKYDLKKDTLRSRSDSERITTDEKETIDWERRSRPGIWCVRAQ